MRIPEKSELDAPLPPAVLREAYVRGTVRWALLPLLAGWALLGYALFVGPVDTSLTAEIEPGGWFGVNVFAYLPFCVGSALLVPYVGLVVTGNLPAWTTTVVALVALLFTLRVAADPVLDYRPLLGHFAGYAAWLLVVAVGAAGGAYLVPGRVIQPLASRDEVASTSPGSVD
ncbi:hypothetical protein [Nocardioides campestrisoli]|uniref:hypothetical protein n=1 Tax=Nocardioides campestrisoli TaxID=2736757 RepID=UPI00163D7496|nr:hypothetical protein [Nocardioides campestrisoli]